MFRSIFALAAVAAAVALFLLYTRPAYDNVRALQTENESYDLALEKATELQRLRQSLLSRYNAFAPADIERLHKLLPDHVDNVRLILDLDTMASQQGLALQNVVVSRPSGDETNSRVIGPARDPYDSVTLTFATATTYDRFLTFLTDLEDSLRIVDLVALSIANDASSIGAAEPVYRFDITLRTYWLK